MKKYLSIFNHFYSINFQRIIPKSGLFKSSEVFKQLNEEAIKTKADKDKEVKKWTTFLQKPNRPIPKLKNQVYVEPYRVKIVKQPKPLCDPNRVRTPPPPVEAVPVSVVVSNETECTVNTETKSNIEHGGDANVENCDLADSEVPDLEECNASELNACVEQQIIENKEKETATENNEGSENEKTENKESETVEATSPAKETVPSGEETQLEKQLLDVQNQLAALSNLPSTIQTMLESVSRQLNEIMPAFKLRTSIDISSSINEDSTLQINEKIDFEKETNTDELHVDNSNTITTETTDSESQIKDSEDVRVEVCANESNGNAVECAPAAKQTDTKLSNDDIARETEEQIVKMKTERVFQLQEEDWSRNKV